MPNYARLQVIGYGAVTSEPTQVLPDTNAPNAYLDDATARANTLGSVAAWTQQQFASQLGGPDTLKVFMAPEFYFRYGGPSQPATILGDSYLNATSVLPNVMEQTLLPYFTTVDFTDWLIIAGTMFWHTEVKDDQDPTVTHPVYFNTVIVIRGGAATSLTPAESAANAQPCTVPTIARSSTNEKQLMSTIDYALTEDRSEWSAALNPMFEPVIGDWNWWRYHAFHVQGVNGPTGDPLTFGLEVCLEHTACAADSGLGVLRTMQQHYGSHCSGPVPDIDVHLVTSCGMTLNSDLGIAAKVGGLAAICDGMQPGALATWPKVSVQRVTDITDTGQHNTSGAAAVLSSQNVPAQLQLGVVGQQHDPADAVSVWEPANLM